jgi:2-polyprenyl-6-methoxyphenol hydroxylase-like FAD-dependent oxidoreductase
MTRFDVDVLVVGAGSTGLTLALQAHAHGAGVRIVDRRAEPLQSSRTAVLHPRTLELLRPLGVTDALLARGSTAPAARLHLKTRVIPVSIDQVDLPGTAFGHLLLIRQADVEAVLTAALAERGVTVERGTELVRLARLRNGGARAVLRPGGAEPDENLHCRYIAGCDGPHSLVRRSVGGWIGGDLAGGAVVADLELGVARPPAAPSTLERDVVHVVAGRRGLVILFDNGERATWRMLATSASGAGGQPPGTPVSRSDLQRVFDESGLSAKVEHVGRSARVRLQHRIASRFSRGPLFVAGDAAHLHAPVGAQGLNSGIHDAVNLGWKLAFAAAAGLRSGDPGAPTGAVPASALPGAPVRSGPALRGGGVHQGATRPGAALPGSGLLDSYAQERRPADLAVLRLTRVLHWAEASPHPFAQLARTALVPTLAPLLPFATRHRRLATAMVRVVAQFRLRYPRSVLSVDVRASLIPVRGALARRGLRPGSRVADTLVRCEGRRVRAHELMAVPGVHIFLQANARRVPERLTGRFVHVHRLDDRPGTGMLVVRPDGYAAVRAPVFDERHLEAWLRTLGLFDG